MSLSKLTCATQRNELFRIEQAESKESAHVAHDSCLAKDVSVVKKVAFGRVQVNKYPIILGDHPACAEGPPITMGWISQPGCFMSVDDYEMIKPSESRKTPAQMELNADVREDILKRSTGVTDEDIEQIRKGIERIQRQRQRTVARLPYSKFEEYGQLISKTLRTADGRRRRSKKNQRAALTA